MAIKFGSVIIHPGYSPAHWVSKADRAHAKRHFEEASGYAYLGYCLCTRIKKYRQIKDESKPAKVEMLPDDFRLCLSIRKSAVEFDKEGIKINSDDIYFDNLRSECVRFLGTALARGGFYEDALPWLKLYLNKGMFSVELNEEKVKEVQGIFDTTNDRITKRMESQYTLKVGDKEMWASPYDVDIDQEGIKRLNNYFKFNISGSVLPLDLGMSLGTFQFDTKEPPPKDKVDKYPPVPEGSDNKDDIHFVRDKYKRPMLMYTGHPANKGKVFFTERSLLSIPYGYNPMTSRGYCEWCCKILPEPPLKDQCCAAHRYAWCNPHESDQCKKIIDLFWHKCIRDRTKLAMDVELKQSRYPSHIYLRAIQRLIHIYQKTPRRNPLHPLQLGVFPFINSNHAGTPPWTFRTGIFEPIALLWKEDIDPFTTSYFDIRSLLILWRKLSAWYVDLPATPGPEPDAITHPNIAIIPLALSFIRISCTPNCALQSNEDGTIRLVAIKDIRKYEELTIPGPVDIDVDDKERLEEFAKVGVYCGCDRCVRGRTNREILSQKRKRDEVEEDSKNSKTPGELAVHEKKRKAGK